jgi:hypothetical protein
MYSRAAVVRQFFDDDIGDKICYCRALNVRLGFRPLS